MRRWLLPGLFLLSLVIRLAGIGSDSFWYDEAFTAHLARLSLPHLLTAIAGDVHPPAFYLVEWVASRVLGNSELALRIPSAIFSAFATTELWQLAKKLGGQRWAWGASLLFLAMPGQQYYAQEARMYAQLTALVLTGTRAAVERNHWRLAPVLGLILYTQNLGAVYAGAIGLLAFWKSGRRAMLPGALAGASWLPWLPTMIHQASDVSNGFWVAPGTAGGTLYYLLFSTFYARIPAWAWAHAAALAIALTLIAVWTLRKEWRTYAPLAIIAFVPVAFLYIASVAWRPVMVPRVLIPSGAAVIALWAAGITKMQASTRKATLAVLVPMIALGMGSYYMRPDVTRYNLQPSVSIVADNWQDHDAVYNLNLDTMITYGYYLPADQYPTFALPHAGDLAQSLTDETKTAMGLKQREYSIDDLASQGYRRVWLMYADSPVVSDAESVEGQAIIDSHHVIATYPTFDDGMDRLIIYLIDLRGDYAAR